MAANETNETNQDVEAQETPVGGSSGNDENAEMPTYATVTYENGTGGELVEAEGVVIEWDENLILLGNEDDVIAINSKYMIQAKLEEIVVE